MDSEADSLIKTLPPAAKPKVRKSPRPAVATAVAPAEHLVEVKIEKDPPPVDPTRVCSLPEPKPEPAPAPFLLVLEPSQLMEVCLVSALLAVCVYKGAEALSEALGQRLSSFLSSE